MSVQNATREADERILKMLVLWDLGETSPQIGARFGLSQQAVRTIIQRVRRDLAASEAIQ
jgi:DNA-directed RNA polymerase specialized sigma24 family protein